MLHTVSTEYKVSETSPLSMYTLIRRVQLFVCAAPVTRGDDLSKRRHIPFWVQTPDSAIVALVTVRDGNISDDRTG